MILSVEFQYESFLLTAGLLVYGCCRKVCSISPTYLVTRCYGGTNSKENYTIHAATMVAASVYMTFRIFHFLTPSIINSTIIGAVATLMAAITAITK